MTVMETDGERLVSAPADTKFYEIPLKVTFLEMVVSHSELALASRVCFFLLNCGKDKSFNLGQKPQ